MLFTGHDADVDQAACQVRMRLFGAIACLICEITCAVGSRGYKKNIRRGWGAVKYRLERAWQLADDA